MTELTNILQQVFKTSALEEVPLASLQEMAEKHPYFAGAQFLLCKKLKQEDDKAFPAQLQKANLYFHNPLWLHFSIAEPTGDSKLNPAAVAAAPEPEVVVEQIHLEEEKKDETELPIPAPAPVPAAAVKEEIPFDPYHTIDYFASLGIRLSQDPKPDDKLGQQLKSFTAWLKTMRRLPAEAVSETIEVNQADLNAHIEKIASNSLVDKEVITQAMAEVLIMQGNRVKAAEIYHKLSLLNPDKSAYFAARIEELKQN